MKYVISASILALAILICAFMPRYYLIVAFPEKPVVQIGPFATQAGCEGARHRILDALLGPATEKDNEGLSLCVSSR